MDEQFYKAFPDRLEKDSKSIIFGPGGEDNLIIVETLDGKFHTFQPALDVAFSNIIPRGRFYTRKEKNAVLSFFKEPANKKSDDQ